MLGGSNQSYYPLSENSSMLQSTPCDGRSSLEWASIVQYNNPSVKSLDYSHRVTPIPNLQARNLLLQREKEESVFRNLNRASNRLEGQRAILPPREWFLPDLIPLPKGKSSKPNLALQIQSQGTDPIDELLDQFPSPTLDRSSTFLTPLCDNLSSLSISSDSSDSRPFCTNLNSKYLSSPNKRPVSQPELPAINFENPSHQRRVSDLSFSSSLPNIETSQQPLPSFFSLLETSTVRLDQQRAPLRNNPARPLSWGGHPLGPSNLPVFDDKVKGRRGSLKSAFERVCKGTLLFKKKSITGLTNAVPTTSNQLPTYNCVKPNTSQPSSPLRASFWGSKRKPT